MSISAQPSILTVCVPGGTADEDRIGNAEALDAFERLSAARENSLQECAGLSRTGKQFSGLQDNCDTCEDSSCGAATVHGSACDRFDSGRDGLVAGESTSGDADAAADAASVRPCYFHADSAKKALELLRMLRFDLLVTGDRLPDMPVGQFIRRVRVAWPWQKWAMVGSVLSARDEIAARTLGAMAVFDAPADWDALGTLAEAAASSGGKHRERVAAPASQVAFSQPVGPSGGMQGAEVVSRSTVDRVEFDHSGPAFVVAEKIRRSSRLSSRASRAASAVMPQSASSPADE
jgi:DNA-binding NarL/FixJ family response regulator